MEVKTRLTLRQAAVYMLLVYYCTFGTMWINRYAFGQQLSGLGQGVTMTLLFLSAYPVLALRRDSPWVRIGSFRGWLLLGLLAGLLTVVVHAFSQTVVRHYSP